MTVLAFSPRETVLNLMADALEARRISCLRRYSAATFPDMASDWKSISLVLMDPSAGYASLPDEWKESTNEGAYTGIVLLERLVPQEIDRSKIPIFLRSSIYDLGIYRKGNDISPSEVGETSIKRLTAAGYRDISVRGLGSIAVTVASEIEKKLRAGAQQ